MRTISKKKLELRYLVGNIIESAIPYTKEKITFEEIIELCNSVSPELKQTACWYITKEGFKELKYLIGKPLKNEVKIDIESLKLKERNEDDTESA